MPSWKEMRDFYDTHISKVRRYHEAIHAEHVYPIVKQEIQDTPPVIGNRPLTFATLAAMGHGSEFVRQIIQTQVAIDRLEE